MRENVDDALTCRASRASIRTMRPFAMVDSMTKP